MNILSFLLMLNLALAKTDANGTWALLEAGTIVFDVREEKTRRPFKIPRSVYVRVLEGGEGSENSFILDKKGRPAYRAKTLDLLSLEKDVPLPLPPPLSPQSQIPSQIPSYAKAMAFYRTDKFFRLTPSLTIHNEFSNNAYFNELQARTMPLPPSRSRSRSRGLRLEGHVFFPWNFPLHLGLMSTYQTGLWKALYFGPILRFPLKAFKTFTLMGQVSFQKSLFMQSADQSIPPRLSSNGVQVDLGARVPLSQGKGFLLLGGSFRYLRPSVKRGKSLLSWPSKRRGIDSLSAFIGYGWPFKI